MSDPDDCNQTVSTNHSSLPTVITTAVGHNAMMPPQKRSRCSEILVAINEKDVDETPTQSNVSRIFGPRHGRPWKTKKNKQNVSLFEINMRISLMSTIVDCFSTHAVQYPYHTNCHHNNDDSEQPTQPSVKRCGQESHVRTKSYRQAQWTACVMGLFVSAVRQCIFTAKKCVGYHF